MDATQSRHESTSEHAAPSNFAPLALKVLSRIANDAASDVNHDSVIDVFCNALTKNTSHHRHQIVFDLQKLGLSNVDIVDRIIPAAARRIGERWVDDELTFAEVTCSAARMQEMSKHLGSRGRDWFGGDASKPRMLLIIPKNEQHTMGAFVAADQFHRLGLTVELALNQGAEDLKRTIKHGNFSLFGISAASRQLIKPVKNIVDILKEFDKTIPVVLGGNILRIDENVQAKTNVDIASPNPSEIVDLCGLPMPSSDVAG